MKVITAFIFCVILLLNGCIPNKPISYCTPPKEIHLGWIKMMKIKRFIGEEEKMTKERSKYNIIEEYCFDRKVADSRGIGLVSVKRRNVSHPFYHFFINGRKSITLLKFPYDKVSEIEDTLRHRVIMEKALSNHSEIDEALKQEIRKSFWFYKKSL